MPIRLMLRGAPAVALVISLAGCGLEAQSVVEGRFDRVLTVAELASLDVRTGSGSITVTSGPAGSLTIAARIRGRAWAGGTVEERVRQIEAAPPVEQDGGAIRIGSVDNRELLRDISISYEIVAPPDVLVIGQTGSGDQRIEGLRGPVAANTGSGSITIRSIQMDVRAATGAGDIRGDRVGGSFEGRAGSGSIQMDGVGGAARARTGSGDVRLSLLGNGNVDAETASGSITVAGARQGLHARTVSGDVRVDGRPSRPWDISTVSGSSHLRLDPDSSFELDAVTRSGSVRVNHPLPAGAISSRSNQARGTVRGVVRGVVRGNVRGGGPRLAISLGSGDITID